MTLTLYLPLYSRDEELAALLYLAGSVKGPVGSGLFYYPLFLCPTGDGRAVVVDPLGGGIKAYKAKTDLNDLYAYVEASKKSYRSFIEAVSRAKDTVERADLEEIVIQNVVSDLTVLTETYDYMAMGDFKPLEAAGLIYEADSEAACEAASTFEEVKCNLLLNVSALDELMEAVREGERFITQMLDREKEIQLRINRYETKLLEKDVEGKIQKIEAEIEKKGNNFFKEAEKKKRRLEPQLKRLTKKYHMESNKAATYQEKSKKTKREKWKILAEVHKKEAEKWRKKKKSLEKQIEKIEKQTKKSLETLEKEKERRVKREKRKISEKRKEKEKILWKVQQEKKNLSILCRDFQRAAKQKHDTHREIHDTLDKYMLETPLREKTRIAVPFVAVRRRGSVEKAFDFIFPRSFSLEKGRGFLGLPRTSLSASVGPTYEHLFTYLRKNLKDHTRKGRLVLKLVEGTAKPLLPEREFDMAIRRGVRKLADLNLVSLGDALRLIWRLRRVS